VAKPELGTKRHCQSCGAKFYDLNKDPIICPRCGAAFVAVAVAGRGGRPEPVVARAVDEEEIEPEVAGPEMVSLDEVEAEEAGKEVVAGDEVEIEEDLAEDDTFLEEEEVADDDVADLIDGDIENDEEA
jgi:uncharacterized protein (TIGR02300 family)